MKRPALLMLVPALIPTSAHAADPKTLDCMVSAMPADARASLVATARALDETDDAPLAPRARAAIQSTAAQCAARYHWSPLATEAASLYVYPALSRAPVDEAIRATGNDPVLWARIFHAMPEHDRAAALLDPKTATSVFVDRLMAAHANLFDGKAARLAGVQASMLETIDLTRQRFLAN